MDLQFVCSSPAISLFLDILRGIEECQRVTIYTLLRLLYKTFCLVSNFEGHIDLEVAGMSIEGHE